MSVRHLAAQPDPSLPSDKCVLVHDMDDVHYNSTRVPGTDRLDSSDLELSFSVSETFLGHVAASLALHRAAGVLEGSAQMDAALSDTVACEILFYDGSIPTVFVEEEDATTGSLVFRMSSIPPPKLRCSLSEARRCLRVWVERKMPLSSSHGGRRFVLGFVLGASEVVYTRPFLSFAKKAKEGTGSKFKYQPVFMHVDTRRQTILGLLARTLDSAHVTLCDLSGHVCDSSAPSRTSADTYDLSCAAPSMCDTSCDDDAAVPAPLKRVKLEDTDCTPCTVTDMVVSTCDWLCSDDLPTGYDDSMHNVFGSCPRSPFLSPHCDDDADVFAHAAASTPINFDELFP